MRDSLVVLGADFFISLRKGQQCRDLATARNRFIGVASVLEGIPVTSGERRAMPRRACGIGPFGIAG
jgi:hypothetical protein